MIYWFLTLSIFPEKQDVFSRTLPCWDGHQDLLPDRQPHHAIEKVWWSVPTRSVQLNIFPRDIRHRILPLRREYTEPYTHSREGVYGTVYSLSGGSIRNRILTLGREYTEPYTHSREVVYGTVYSLSGGSIRNRILPLENIKLNTPCGNWSSDFFHSMVRLPVWQ